MRREGRLLGCVFQHPDGLGHGDATYEIRLPELSTGRKLVMKFATVITNRSQDGVRFAVLVDGNELWSETRTVFLPPDSPATQSAHAGILPGRDPFADYTLDLSKHAGQTIRLTLRVDALANKVDDWANWVEPRIVEEPY